MQRTWATGQFFFQLCAALAGCVVHRTVGISLRHAEVARRMRLLLAYGLPLSLTGLTGKLCVPVRPSRRRPRFHDRAFFMYVVGAVKFRQSSQQSVNSVLVPARGAALRGGLWRLLWRRAIRSSTSLVLLPAPSCSSCSRRTPFSICCLAPATRRVQSSFAVYLLLRLCLVRPDHTGDQARAMTLPRHSSFWR